MQILANALPGFRDMRAPLTAGYLWLVFAWLVATPDLSTRPSEPVLASVYDLATNVGPIWVGIGAGTLAYLAGAVTQIVTDYVEMRVSPATRARRRQLKEFDIDPSHKSLRLIGFPSGATIRDAQDTATEALESAGLGSDERWMDRVERGGSEAISKAAEELDLPATLLVGNEPTLFAEVDRMRAEGEIRIAVGPPLIALIIFLAVQWTPWTLLGLLAVAALARHGGVRKAESRKLIADAMRTGRIESPAAKAYQDAMVRLIQEIPSAPNAPLSVDGGRG